MASRAGVASALFLDSPGIAICDLHPVDRLGALGFFLFVNLGRLVGIIAAPQPA